MNLDQLKAALSVDAGLEAARRRARDEHVRSRLEQLESAALLEEMRALAGRAEKLIGDDSAAFDALRSKRLAELTKVAQVRMAECAQGAADAIASLQHGFENVRAATDLLISNGGFGGVSPYVSLDTALVVQATPGIRMPKMQCQPWNNWAHISFNSSVADTAEQGHSTGYEELAFLFPWENASGAYAVINVTSRLGLVGGLIIFRDGQVFGSSSVSVAIDAHLRLLECWGPGPSLSEPSSQTAQTAHILDGSLSGGGLFDMDDIAQAPVNTVSDVSYKEMVVPTGGVVLIEVVLGIAYAHSDDASYVNLELGGDYGQVLCPAVRIQYLTPPPGSHS